MDQNQNNISLEKVINGLECCLEGLSDLCAYKDSDAPGGCKDELMYDALALLKAQEPRVITNADFENKELVDSAESMPAWIEHRHGEEWDEYTDGNDDGWSVVYQFNFESEFYRCWTAKPSLKQMEDTPWP